MLPLVATCRSTATTGGSARAPTWGAVFDHVSSFQSELAPLKWQSLHVSPSHDVVHYYKTIYMRVVRAQRALGIPGRLAMDRRTTWPQNFGRTFKGLDLATPVVQPVRHYCFSVLMFRPSLSSSSFSTSLSSAVFSVSSPSTTSKNKNKMEQKQNEGVTGGRQLRAHIHAQ